jgi:hypothetical protein
MKESLAKCKVPAFAIASEGKLAPLLAARATECQFDTGNPPALRYGGQVRNGGLPKRYVPFAEQRV